MRTAARLAPILLPALLLGALAACGSDDDGGAAGPGGDDASTSDASHDAGGAHDGASHADATTDANAHPDTSTGDDSSTQGGDDSSTRGDSSSSGDASDAGATGPFDGAVKVVVLRVGDGTSALTNAATAVYLDEYALAANAGVIATTAMPIATSGANQPFTLSGTATSEGQMTLAADGHSIVLAGYAAEPGLAAVAKTGAIPPPDAGTDASDASTEDASTEDASGDDASSDDAGDMGDDGGDAGSSFVFDFDPFAADAGDAGPAPLVPRVVARVAANGGIDTSTLLYAFSGNDVRSAASLDGTQFWVAGAGTKAGVQYATLGSIGASTSIVSSPSNVRVVELLGGRLFASSGASPFVGVSSIGAGEPTTASSATLLFPPAAVDAGDASAGPALSPFAFVAFDLDTNVAGIDRMYVADWPNSGTGGIQKWTFDGSNWSFVAELAEGESGNQGMLGLTGFADASGTVTLVATTSDTPSRLVAYVDDGSTTHPTQTILAVSAKNTAFRGVTLEPR